MTNAAAREKSQLRVQARARRAQLAPSQPDYALQLSRFAETLALPPRAIVAGYMALPDEADPSLLLENLAALGHEICFPRVREKAHPLDFHVRIGGEEMARGAFSIPEPRPHWPRAVPDVLLVPLLAFDARGNRLGYGGGYYDRTLAHLRREKAIATIGIAFAGQKMEKVPTNAGDQPLDAVLSEHGLLNIT